MGISILLMTLLAPTAEQANLYAEYVDGDLRICIYDDHNDNDYFIEIDADEICPASIPIGDS